MAARSRVRRKDRHRFDSLVILVAWLLWKQRNARVFGNIRDQCTVEQLTGLIREEFSLWEMARTGGSRTERVGVSELVET